MNDRKKDPVPSSPRSPKNITPKPGRIHQGSVDHDSARKPPKRD